VPLVANPIIRLAAITCGLKYAWALAGSLLFFIHTVRTSSKEFCVSLIHFV
jgi:hypothetical protein